MTGFSFYQGETGKASGTSSPTGYQSDYKTHELPGGGGGWFGGYSSHHNNGGGSGGSSFALSSNATIPSGKINIYDKNYQVTSSRYYAFPPSTSPYLFYNIEHKRGVWNGNGRIIITKIGNYNICRTKSCIRNIFSFRSTLIIMISR